MSDAAKLTMGLYALGDDRRNAKAEQIDLEVANCLGRFGWDRTSTSAVLSNVKGPVLEIPFSEFDPMTTAALLQRVQSAAK